jgi:hypothetical protein
MQSHVQSAIAALLSLGKGASTGRLSRSSPPPDLPDFDFSLLGVKNFEENRR